MSSNNQNSNQNSVIGKAVAAILSLVTAAVAVLKLSPNMAFIGLAVIVLAGAFIFILLGFKKQVYGVGCAVSTGLLCADIFGGHASGEDIPLVLMAVSCLIGYFYADSPGTR